MPKTRRLVDAPGSKATSAIVEPDTPAGRAGAVLEGARGLDRELPASALFGFSEAGDARVPLPSAQLCSSSSLSGVERTMLAITAPTGIWVGCSCSTASSVSVTGMSSSRVTRCTTVVSARSIAMIESAWLRIGPTLASPETASCTLRNWAIRPVGGASSTTASYASSRPFCWRRTASYTLPVSSTSRRPGRDRGGEVGRAELVEGPRGETEVVEGLQVLQQRVLGVDRQAVHGTAGRGAGQPRLLGAVQRRPTEQVRDAVPALDLAHQHAAPGRGQRAGQRDGDRRLAGATLAADDVQGVPRQGGRHRPSIAPGRGPGAAHGSSVRRKTGVGLVAAVDRDQVGRQGLHLVGVAESAGEDAAPPGRPPPPAR